MRINKHQIFVFFVLIMLFGAWFVATAVMSVVDVGKPQQQLVFDGPLSNQDEATFLMQNKVVAKYFWSVNCTACAESNETINALFQDFGGSLVVENIDADQWADVAEALDVKELPTLYLKGMTIDVIAGNITYDDAYGRICNVFFEPIEQCQTFIS